jgi:hypothetical protein
MRSYLNSRYPQSPEDAKSRGLVFNPDHQLAVAKKIQHVNSEWNIGWLTGVISPKTLFFTINAVGIVAAILVEIEMGTSIQTTLKVIDRNALLQATVFLTPFAEIFAFLEDIISVRVQYALAAGRNREVGKLIKWGFWCGLACGSFAAGLITIFAYVPSIFEALVAPAASKDASLYPNCSSPFLPTPEEQIAESRSFWLLAAWEFPGQFALSTLLGFLAGTFELIIMSLASLISEVSIVPIWFGGKGSASNELELLGIAGFVGSYLAIGFVLTYAFCTKRMRTQYHMHLFGSGSGSDAVADVVTSFNTNTSLSPSLSTALTTTKTSSAIAKDEAGDATTVDPTFAELFKEGGQIMAVDVCLQVPKAVAVYVAATTAGTAAVYQLSVAMTLMSVIGPPFIAFPLFFLATYGPQLLAKRFYSAFRVLAYGSVGIALVVGVASCAIVYSNVEVYAYSFGAQSCVYAGTAGCSGVYHDIFNAEGSMDMALRAWGVCVIFECVLRVLRKSMTAQCDFRFMAQASAFCFFCGFIPAIAVVYVHFPAYAYCYLIAMYVPHTMMCIIFAGRFYCNMQKMMAGEPGPWSVHAMSTAQIAAMQKNKASQRRTLADQLNSIIGVEYDLENPSSQRSSVSISTAPPPEIVEPAPAQKLEGSDQESRDSAVYASGWDRYFLSPKGGGHFFMWVPVISWPFQCWYHLLRPCFFTQPPKTGADRDMEEGGLS